MVTLQTELVPFKRKGLRNPIILASGCLCRNAHAVKRMHQAGAGAVVLKSVGPEPRRGFPYPRVIKDGFRVINAEGIPNPGYVAFAKEVKEAGQVDIPVIAAIFGVTIDDYVRVGAAMEEAGADALEIGYAGALVKSAISSANPYDIEAVVKAVKKVMTIPVISKLSLKDNLKELARASEAGGADAIAAIHGLPALMIDVDTGKPRLGRETGFGALGGPSIKPVAIKAVADIALTVSLPIVGIGGVASGRDAIEMIMVGASAVGVHSIVLLEGPSVFNKITDEMKRFMEARGYNKITDFRGLALDYIRKGDPYRQIDG